MPLISRADAARALGVTKEAVYAAIRTGRLSVINARDGRVLVNSETMRDEWAQNTQRRIGVGPRPPANAPRPERLARTPAPTDDPTADVPEYNVSRARTEHLKAELLELERQQKESLLVPAAEIEAKWVEIITLARTKILGIPTKAKQRIPDLDVSAITVLDDIVRETLEDLSGDSPDDDTDLTP
jgi:hypothetical protein